MKVISRVKLDGVYHPLNDSIGWLTTCIEEMRQDIAKIQQATDAYRHTSIDKRQHASINNPLPTSIDQHLPASVDNSPPHSPPMKSPQDFHTREEIDHRNSQSIAVGLLRFWDSPNFEKDSEFMRITVLFLDNKVNCVIHGFISAVRANHYMPSLKAGSIVKVDHFEVSRYSNMYMITDHSFLIHFIPPTIIDEVITDAPEINLQS
uniref:Replication protein A 70 kDa DNA-binding subunit B/D first OB fold domain-containing protein n=1 Tax=Brassica oleracea var. oleracea TaxID=109376 RepID=A0A0D3DLI6_BRAOL